MKDLRQTDDGDLYLTDSGDIAYAVAAQVSVEVNGREFTAIMQGCVGQHKRDLTLAHKGEYRLSPTVGVGASDYLEDEDTGGLTREVNKQFVKDGMKVASISEALEVIAGY